MIFKFNKRSIKLPSSSSGPSTSSESIFPDEDIFEEPPKIAIPQNGLSDLIPQQKKGRGRPAKSAALSLSLLGPDKSTESILPDDFVEISLSQLSKVAINGRSKRSPKLKGTPNKTKSSTVSSNRDIYGMDPMSEITKVGNSELEPEQITGILSYLKKHKRSSSTSPDEKPQIVPKLEIKPEIVLETDKTNHIVQNGESPPPDPMLSSAADPAIPCKVEQSELKQC